MSILLDLVLKFGKKWSVISKNMPGRTEHSVKNHYQSILKKYKELEPKTKQRLKKQEIFQKEINLTKLILKKLSGKNDLPSDVP